MTRQMLEEVLGTVQVDKAIIAPDSGITPKAPGMKYRHYAPKAELTIISGTEQTVVNRINQLAEKEAQAGKKVGIIGTDETVSRYQGFSVKSAGNRKEEETIAKELYRILREFDDEEVDVIYSESFEEDGLGQAVMNRLLKAAGHRVEQV